jgi:aryl-alcohol dehydrogenase-like predicted oxidoreductase
MDLRTTRLTRAQFLRLAAGGAALCVSGPTACADPARPGVAAVAPPPTPEPPATAAMSMMHTRPIPSSGEALPVVGCGTWRGFDVGGDAEELARLGGVVDALHAAGGKVIDTSPMYGQAERVIGRLLADPGRRARSLLATKVWTRGRAAGIAQMRESMRLMGAERLELMQVHNLLDTDAHWPVLRERKDEGRVRYLGLTHYTESAYPDLEAAMQALRPDFVQFNYSIDARVAERRLLPLAAGLGIAVIVNLPFGGGGLLGALRDKPLPGFAAEVGCTSWAQLLLKFVLGHPAVTCVIPGTSKPRHMADNAQAGAGVVLDEGLRARVVEAWKAAVG